MKNLREFLITCLVGVMFVLPILGIGYLLVEYPDIFGGVFLGLIVIGSIWIIGYIVRSWIAYND